jgi:mono/diheme cytochrome c family protein
MMNTRRSRGIRSIPGIAAALAAAGVLSVPAPPAAQTQTQPQVTFAKHIAPILQRTCQNCHRPNGGLAPMALTTYEEVRPWARAIKLRTAKREMPPWFIEKNVGIQHFKDDPSLSDEEIATIGAWVDNGAPLGNPADMPPPRKFTDTNAWNIGQPDLIIDSPLMTVEPVAGDNHIPYIGAVPTGLTEDRWIAAFEVKEFRPGETVRTPGRPGGGNDFFVLHHQVMSSVPLEEGGGGGEDAAAAAATIERLKGTFNYVYEVGQNAQYIPKDVGIALKAGGKIYFNSTHLHSIGKEVKLNARVGFKLHPKGYQPKYPQGTNGRPANAGNGGLGAELDIPGNTSNVRFDKFYRFDKPAQMVTFEPHLHASGTRMCVEAIWPDGRSEMLNCTGYNHAWVKTYTYEDDYAPLLPTGTILHVIGFYNNSASNPRVVDPRNWRGTGHRSIDDMLILLSKYITYSDEEFKQVVAEREARLKQTRVPTTTQQN